MDRLTIKEVSRQPLILGTSRFTDPAGNIGFKTKDVQASALVRIAAALERQTDMLEAQRTGFTPEQARDGQSHFHAHQAHDSRLVHIEVLGSTSVVATQFLQNIKAVLVAAGEAARTPDGQPDVAGYIAQLQADNERLRAVLEAIEKKGGQDNG